MRARNLFVVVQHSPHLSPALRRAIAMARAGKCRLHLCLTEYVATIDALGTINNSLAQATRETILDERARWLHDKVESLRHSGLEVSSEVIWGHPQHRLIIEKASAAQADLVIKDIHLEPLLKRVMLTPVDWHLLRECPLPLMLVNSRAHPLPGRVIAAVEPVASDHSAHRLNERILETARDHAALAGIEAELAYVFDSALPLMRDEAAFATSAVAEAYEQIRMLHVKRFDEFAAANSVAPQRRHVLYGVPWLALADLANDSTRDLLVLGTLQRGALDRLLLGSTAERILAEAGCDLLAIPPDSVARNARRASHVPLAATA